MQPVLIYDAECRLCSASKEILSRWDRKGRIRFVPFQDPQAVVLAPDLPREGCLDAMRFVGADGRVQVGVDALRALLPALPLGRPLALLFLIPGIPALAWWIYRRVAENRYRWFGRKPAG